MLYRVRSAVWTAGKRTLCCSKSISDIEHWTGISLPSSFTRLAHTSYHKPASSTKLSMEYNCTTEAAQYGTVQVHGQYSYWRFKYSHVQFVTVTNTHLRISKGGGASAPPCPCLAASMMIMMMMTTTTIHVTYSYKQLVDVIRTTHKQKINQNKSKTTNKQKQRQATASVPVSNGSQFVVCCFA